MLTFNVVALFKVSVRQHRLQADPGWQVHDLPTAHNAMREAPDAVAALLLDERPADASTPRRKART